ncbi:MAG TPA: wax ester/triacylglycerol synthase family O-acyltransferase [Rubrivivax sp.]|nr:wax ester/triacylglycerol synthase family O-acyltransferase [Rubrivivax sp.]
MPATAERMSRVDHAWLRMDSDVNLMTIVGVWLLRPALSHRALCRRIEQRLLHYPRFRQKVLADARGARWVDDERFAIGRHVLHERLERRRGRSQREALQQRCGELASTRLDPAHPLWQFHLIERYDGGSAVIVRVHHCIGDGIALTAVLMSITDGGEPPPRALPRDAAPRDEGLGASVLEPLRGLAGKAAELFDQGLARSKAFAAQPRAGLRDLARNARRAAADLAALALMDDDAPTPLKGTPVGRKHVAWAEPVPLDVVKAVGKTLRASVNDVLLACVAGAIGGYLRDIGVDVADKAVRAVVPVNLRPLHQAHQLGNQFGLVPLLLPIGVDDPVERVAAVHARMSELKDSWQPLLAFGVLALAGQLNEAGQRSLLDLFAKKATAVMTNVPGPPQALRLCGATLRQCIVWVPQTGNVAVGVSIFSYAGGVQFGLIADAALCPEPQRVVERFAPELDKLLWLTLMLPWAA